MIAQALVNLRPGATWVIRGEESYEAIEWTDSQQSIPTKEEVLARMNNQMNDNEKRKMTSLQILNDGESPLLKQLEEVIERLKIV